MPQAAAVSKDDLGRAINLGMTRTDLAEELDCSRTAVSRAVSRHRMTYPLFRKSSVSPMGRLREEINDMKPLEAVDYLLFVVEKLVDGTLPDIGGFPDANMTPLETAIVRYRAVNEGKCMQKALIHEAIYLGAPEAPEMKIVDVLVCKIRKKIAGTGASVETVWGQGYRFVREPGAVFPWEAEKA